MQKWVNTVRLPFIIIIIIIIAFQYGLKSMASSRKQ